jgi:hypothetical protein
MVAVINVAQAEVASMVFKTLTTTLAESVHWMLALMACCAWAAELQLF